MLVFDGSHLIHRMKYTAFSMGGKMASSNGICFLFIKSIISSINKYNPTGIVVLWDYGYPKHRLEACPQYKANRDRTPDDASEAMDKARATLTNILPLLNILPFGYPDAEADDLGFLLSKVLKSGLLVSEDDDWTQSVNPNFKLYKPIADKFTSYDDLIKWYSDNGKYDPIRVHSYIKAITGDSDNIPKIMHGVGGVTARKAVWAMFDGKPMPKNLDDFRDKIETNFRAIDMSWILSNRIPVMDEMIDTSRQLKNTLDMSDWVDIISAINSPSLASKYDMIRSTTSGFNYSQLRG